MRQGPALIGLAALATVLLMQEAAAQQARVQGRNDGALPEAAAPAAPALRTTLSADSAAPAPQPLPEATLLPSTPETVTMRPAPAAVKRRTGKITVAVPAQPRIVRATRVRTAGLRTAMVPVVVERNQGPGRVLPNANPYAPGATIVPDTGEIVGALPPRRAAAEVLSVDGARLRLDDPAFEPVGLRFGVFEIRPYGEAALGYHSNPYRLRDGERGSLFETFALGATAQSDWSRHSLSLALRGTYTDYRIDSQLNRGEFGADMRGRIDVSHDTRVDVDARYALTPRVPQYGMLAAFGPLARTPLSQQYGAGMGVEHDLNRLRLSLRGTVNRYNYENSRFVSGLRMTDAPPDYTAFGLRLRAQYELSPSLRPFAEASYERRIYDPVNSDADIYTLRGGASVEMNQLLVGELSGGVYHWRNRGQDALRGGLVDASLAWMPTALTTVTGRATSTLAETGFAGASGLRQTDLSLQLDHAFRRYFIATARVGFGFDKYFGIDREDNRFTASVAATYKVSRSLQIRGELRHERLKSNVSGVDYTANIAMIGLRLQR